MNYAVRNPAHNPRELSEPTPEDQSIILDATLALSGTQLLAQIADETSLDGRTMGVLGFNGALLAAGVAAKDLLGTWWWAPLPFVAFATAFCLKSIFADDVDLGPKALTFYATYGGQAASEARVQLLADMEEAFKNNAKRVKKKATALRWALGILTTGLIVAALLIALDRPSKVGAHVQRPAVPAAPGPRAHPAAARAGSGPVGSAARGPRRHYQPLVA